MGGVLGACHGLDVPLVFGNLDRGQPAMLIGDGPNPEAEALSARMRAAWTAFAADGDPGWPAYDAEQRLVQLFDARADGRRLPGGDVPADLAGPRLSPAAVDQRLAPQGSERPQTASTIEGPRVRGHSRGRYWRGVCPPSSSPGPCADVANDAVRSQSHGGLMRPFEIGLVLPLWDSFVDGSTPRWVEIRELALRAEELGFDTVWIPDELLWRPTADDPRGGGRRSRWRPRSLRRRRG